MIRTQNRNSFFKTTNHATKHPCNNKNSRCTSILTQNITKLLQRYITVNCQKQVKKHNPCTHPKRYNLSKNNNNIIIKFKKINKARNEKKKKKKTQSTLFSVGISSPHSTNAKLSGLLLYFLTVKR